jgi:hypothetical protein
MESLRSNKTTQLTSGQRILSMTDPSNQGITGTAATPIVDGMSLNSIGDAAHRCFHETEYIGVDAVMGS